MPDHIVSDALNILSEFLSWYYDKKAIILLDEYDTPMQEAYVYGYWEEMSAFIRSLFNSTFKTNPYMERAIMTGITRIGKESIFSDLNHLEAVTSTSRKYQDSFGFTEEEVFASMDEFGLTEREKVHELSLTNKEVRLMFKRMIRGWFAEYTPDYNAFVKALLLGDKKAMNAYMNRIALATFSCFDTGNRPFGKAQPERFYHGFVLGLIVDLADRYRITSNRESGFGRYDVALEPKDKSSDAFLFEFKVRDPQEEGSLEDTVAAALSKMEEKKYAYALIEQGIPAEKIRSYGFAFEGKRVLIG